MRPVVSKLDEEPLFRIFFLRLRPFFLWDAMIYDPLGQFMILLRLIGWIRGGFSATLLEDSSDVEYVFYGLLALGAL